MLYRRDIEMFEILATSFILRGRKSWLCSELAERLETLGMSTDCDVALANLSAAGWVRETSDDIFELTNEGVRMAREKVGPFASGGV